MRRSTRLSLLFAVVLLVLVGVYAAYWFVVAGRIEAGFGEWAQSLRAHNLDLAWRAIRVGGFPLAFEVELDDAQLRDSGSGPGAAGRQVSMPVLSGSARPWNLLVWRLAAPGGLSAIAGPADRPTARLSARAATGSVVVSGDGGATLWFGLSEPSADVPEHLAAREAGLWLTLPAHQPEQHTERAVGAALDVRGLTLPIVPAPLHNPIDEIAFGVTLMGAVSAGSPREAAVAWRDSGGTLEIDHVAAHWGALAVSGSGTLALDRDLQPMGAFSGAVEGYDELMSVLVATGRVRAGDANIARLALGMLARRGPDGRPSISTSFTLQNGEMFLGPAKLGKAPRILWE